MKRYTLEIFAFVLLSLNSSDTLAASSQSARVDRETLLSHLKHGRQQLALKRSKLTETARVNLASLSSNAGGNNSISGDVSVGARHQLPPPFVVEVREVQRSGGSANRVSVEHHVIDGIQRLVLELHGERPPCFCLLVIKNGGDSDGHHFKFY